MENREVKIKEILNNLGEKNYRLTQITDAIYKNDKINSYSQMFMIPQKLREELTYQMGDSIFSLREIAKQRAGETEKFVFETNDGHKIETVKMHYEEGRNTYCLSVQAGCGMNCAFCATGKMGLKRNLTVDEIIDQVLYLKKKGYAIDNIVFMGMGEPFANPATFDALEILVDQKKMGIGQRHISVSTVGIVPGIRKMTEEQPQINLAFSLHSPFQEERERIMPISKTYPITDVMDALVDHIKVTKRKVFIVYTLLGGVNDTSIHAKALAELLNSYKNASYLFHVNLINYHEIAGEKFKKSSTADVKTFREILKNKGVVNTLRQDFGESIDAACGQLSGKN